MNLVEGLLVFMAGAVVLAVGVFFGTVISYVAHQQDEKDVPSEEFFWGGDALYEVEWRLADMSIKIEEREALVNEILNRTKKLRSEVKT